MGSKITNNQAAVASPAEMSQGIASAFGDVESEARKRKKQEDDAAAASAAQTQEQASGQEPSAWDTMKSMGSDLVSGAKAMAADAGGAWGSIKGKKK